MEYRISKNTTAVQGIPIGRLANLESRVSALEVNPGLAIGDAIGSATAGSIFFAGTSGVLAQDNTNLFWDDSNDRLGIGTNSPSFQLHVSKASGLAETVIGVTGSAASDRAMLFFSRGGSIRWDMGVNTQAAGDNNFYLRQDTSNSSIRLAVASSTGFVGVMTGTVTPAASLHIIKETADTNSILEAVRIQRATTGTAAVGSGAAINFAMERSDGVSEFGGRIYMVTQNVTSGVAKGSMAIETATNGSFLPRLFIDGSLGHFAIGTTTVTTTHILDILGTNGWMRIADTATDATNKNGRFSVRHYTASEEDMGGLFLQSTSTLNSLSIGGGTSTFNAATQIGFYTAANNTTTTGTLRMLLDSSGNFGIGTASFGTNAAGVLALFNGTAPTTSPADTVQLFSADISAGNASLGIRTETAVVTESVTSDRTLAVTINGTVYKICLKA